MDRKNSDYLDDIVLSTFFSSRRAIKRCFIDKKQVKWEQADARDFHLEFAKPRITHEVYLDENHHRNHVISISFI